MSQSPPPPIPIQRDMHGVQMAMHALIEESCERREGRHRIEASTIRTRQLRKAKQDFVEALHSRADGKAVALAGATTRSSADAASNPPSPRDQARRLVAIPPSIASRSQRTDTKSSLAPSPPALHLLSSGQTGSIIAVETPRCRIGAHIKNATADLVFHEHLMNVRTVLDAHRVSGVVHRDAFDALDAAFNDLQMHTTGNLSDLLGAIKVLTDVVSIDSTITGGVTENCGPSTSGLNRAVGPALRRDGAWLHEPYIFTAQRVSKAFRSLQLQCEQLRLELQRQQIVQDSVANSPLGGAGRTQEVAAAGIMAHTSGGGVVGSAARQNRGDGSAAASEMSQLTTSLLAENKQLRTELRQIRRDMRDVKAEAIHYRSQAESLQANLTTALNRMLEITTRQRNGAKSLDPQSIAMIIHSSNQAIAQMLSLPFSGPGATEDVAPDAPEDLAMSEDPESEVTQRFNNRREAVSPLLGSHPQSASRTPQNISLAGSLTEARVASLK